MVFFFSSHQLTYQLKYKEIMLNPPEWIAERVDQGSLNRQISFLLLGLFALCSLLIKKKMIYPSEQKINWIFIIFLVFIVMSIGWAEDTRLAVRRVIRYLIPCLAAFALTRRFRLQEVIKIAFIISLSYLILGIFTEVYFGTLSPFEAEYRFCGTGHPNWQAWNIILVLFSSITLIKDKKNIIYILIVIISLIFLVLTKSRISFIFLIVTMIIYFYTKISTTKKLYLAIIFGFFICLSLLIIQDDYIESIINPFLLGRKEGLETFSGRIPMWIVSFQYISEKPLLGYGFNSFWTSKHILEISSELQDAVPAAHSSYIDLLLGVGIIGLVLYLIAFFGTIFKYFKEYINTRNNYVGFGLMILLFHCFTMAGEEIAFTSSFNTFLIIILFFVCPKNVTKNI
jgi:O-antigen ligase